METYYLKGDLKVLAVRVTTFPDGIGQAFNELINMLPDGINRAYYGISSMVDNAVVYRAAAEEKYDGEAEKYHCERFVIEKGEYLAVTLRDWRKNIGAIKNIFHDLTDDKRVDNSKFCVEWYKDNEEMICMMKVAKV